MSTILDVNGVCANIGRIPVLRGVELNVKAGETVVAAGSFYLKTALLQERIGDEH